ncbi:MAG: hypothetical protein WCK35_14555 [Chloroflexota bacterium]
MGRTLPTITQQLSDTEAALVRFRRTLRRSDQYILDGLFAAARRHTAAISQTDALLPFEAALLAILLEQAKEVSVLRQELDQLKNRGIDDRTDRLVD